MAVSSLQPKSMAGGADHAGPQRFGWGQVVDAQLVVRARGGGCGIVNPPSRDVLRRVGGAEPVRAPRGARSRPGVTRAAVLGPGGVAVNALWLYAVTTRPGFHVHVAACCSAAVVPFHHQRTRGGVRAHMEVRLGPLLALDCPATRSRRLACVVAGCLQSRPETLTSVVRDLVVGARGGCPSSRRRWRSSAGSSWSAPAPAGCSWCPATEPPPL